MVSVMDVGFSPHNGAVVLQLRRHRSRTGGPVAAVVTDGLEVIAVARGAARGAQEASQPAVLLVPLRRPAFTTDVAVARLAYERSAGEAEAIASRARPLLEAAGVATTARVVWHRPVLTRSPGRASSRAAARKAGAAFLITPGPLVKVSGTRRGEPSGPSRSALAESARAADRPQGASR